MYVITNLVITGLPALTVNIMKNTKSSSVVVQWDEVDDTITTTYIVTWTSERDMNDFHSHILIEQSSYTITELTLDTVYTITVTASNMCGTGPEYKTDIILIVTISSIVPTASIAPVTIATYATTTITTTTTTITDMIFTSSTQCNYSAITNSKCLNTSKV